MKLRGDGFQQLTRIILVLVIVVAAYEVILRFR
jgi:hypothetical protein